MAKGQSKNQTSDKKEETKAAEVKTKSRGSSEETSDKKEETKAADSKKKDKKYKVIALSVVGRKNRVFTAGEELLESAFEPGEADKKVKDGFLEEVK